MFVRFLLNTDSLEVGVYLYGWRKDGETKYLIPFPGAPDMFLVPDEIIKVFRCGCTSENLYKLTNCSCDKTRLPCSTFCKFVGGISCTNPFDVRARNKKDEDMLRSGCGWEVIW